MTQYNGWSSYETWLTRLWMDETQGSYLYHKDLALHYPEPAALAKVLQGNFDAHMPDVGESGLYRDLMNAAALAINWDEIAHAMLSDLEENE